jgi:hypothetical protein
VSPATRDTFFQEAIKWAADLSLDRNNIGIFLFSGHGFGLGFDRRVLALSDVGESTFAPFQGCISFDSFYAGLAPSAHTPEMARQQYFFLDSGVNNLPIPDFLERNASHIFAVRETTIPDDRVAPIFSAAQRGGSAWSHVDGLTVFVEALLRCLHGSGAEQGSPTVGYDATDWVITARSLAQGLEAESRTLQLDNRPFIQFGSSGLMGSSVLHELHERPAVPIWIDFSSRTEPELELRFQELPNGEHTSLLLQGQNRRQEIRLPAGVYQAAMFLGGAPAGAPMLVLAHPPFAEVRL